VKISCHKGMSDLGANLAIALVDISETGARLTVKSTLEKGQMVAIALEGREHVRPIKCTATVVRSETDADGSCRIAVLWDKRLSFSELLKMT
jgi:PilZ domain